MFPDPRIRNLIGQYLKRRAERGGLVWEYRQGLPLGCPLSPLLGAVLLTSLDGHVPREGVVYVRYMDDILVMATTRWKLRRAIRVVKQGLSRLGLTPHPDKTWVRKAEQGFYFLGGMLKKAASGVLALLPCSRTESTLRASKWLRPCWTDFFEHSLPLVRAGLPEASMGLEPEIFNRPLGYRVNQEGLTVAPATVQRGVTRICRLEEHNRRRPSQASAVGVSVSRWWRWADGGLPDVLPLTSPLAPPIANQAQ